MKICLVGLDNLPVLAPEYGQHTIGGESVQQTLLARALARRGHDVSMVVGDYGQPDGAEWEAIRVFKAYRPDAGLPVLRFIHPRWTGMWSALGAGRCRPLLHQLRGHARRPDGPVLPALSQAIRLPRRERHGLRRSRVRCSYALRAIAGSTHMACGAPMPSSCRAPRRRRLWRGNYGLASRVAGMLVEKPPPVGRPRYRRAVGRQHPPREEDRTGFSSSPASLPKCRFTWWADRCPARKPCSTT